MLMSLESNNVLWKEKSNMDVQEEDVKENIEEENIEENIQEDVKEEESKSEEPEEKEEESKEEESKEETPFDYDQYEINDDGKEELDTAFDGISDDHKKQVLDWYFEKTKELQSQQETPEQAEERQKAEQKEITDSWDKASREDPFYGKDYDKYSEAQTEVLKKHLSEDQVKTLDSFIFMKHPIMREFLAKVGNDYNDDKIEYGKATSGDGVKRDQHGNIILSYDKKG